MVFFFSGGSRIKIQIVLYYVQWRRSPKKFMFRFESNLLYYPPHTHHYTSIHIVQ